LIEKIKIPIKKSGIYIPASYKVVTCRQIRVNSRSEYGIIKMNSINSERVITPPETSENKRALSYFAESKPTHSQKIGRRGRAKNKDMKNKPKTSIASDSRPSNKALILFIGYGLDIL
jgi:hypothetical protein